MDSNYNLLIVDVYHDLIHGIENYLVEQEYSFQVIDSLSKAEAYLKKNIPPKLIIVYTDDRDDIKLLAKLLHEAKLESTYSLLITKKPSELNEEIKDKNLVAIDILNQSNDSKEILNRIDFLLKQQDREADKIKRLQTQITILQKTEKRFQNLLASFPNGLMLILDRNYRIYFMDGAEMSNLGLIKDKVIGRTLNTIFPANITTRLMTFFDGAWRGNKIQFEFEYEGNTYLTSAASIEEGESKKQLLVTMQNINDKRKLEKKIEESEKKYRTFFENDLTGDYLSTPEKGIIDCNPAFAKIFGYSSVDEVLKANINKIYTDPSERIEFIEKLTKEKKIENSEINMVKKDGTPVTIIENVVGYFDDNGKLLQFQGFIFDITDIRKAQQAQREADERLRNIMLNTSNMFYQHDINHKLMYVSPQIERILGYTPEEAMKKWTEFASDNPINEEGFTKTIKAIETGEPQGTYELELVHKNGKKVWVEVRESPIKQNGVVTSIIGSLLDITERILAEKKLKESEQKYRTHFNDFPIPIFEWKFDGNSFRLNGCNEAVLDISGGNFNKIANILAEDLYTTSETKPLLDALYQCYSDKESIKKEFKYELRTTGETKWISGTWIFIEPDLVLLHTEDITERKKAEEELKERMAEIQKFNKIMIGRENKMIELKDEINELYQKLGQQKKYKAPDKL